MTCNPPVFPVQISFLYSFVLDLLVAINLEGQSSSYYALTHASE